MDAITARECLADTIIDRLRSEGFFMIDLAPGQDLIDLRWAALVAGRHVGCHLEAFVSDVGRSVPGKVTVLVAPSAWRARPFGLDTAVGSIVQDLLRPSVADREVPLSA